MALLLVLSAALLFYTYVGYPLLLRFVVWWYGPRRVVQRETLPFVSLVISAHDELSSIRDKIENSLSLDYPPERLEVLVVSDASTDGTDEIVTSYAPHGVRLERLETRKGKTAGLNAVVPALNAEIVVFSDANAMYEPGALRALTRNFADHEVGCVVGEARYIQDTTTTASRGESTYWNYELQVKRLETAVGSVVGGDGAIYAIRKHLWQALPETAINDFLNPLQIVAAGWRAVYEPAAVSYEHAAGDTRREYRRRVRIVSRSWRALFQVRRVLNPFHVGFFAISVVSHKVLRWLSGLFVLVLLLAGLAVISRTPQSMPAVFASAAVAGVSLLTIRSIRRAAAVGVYFGGLQMAALHGVVRGTFGRVSATWAHPRMTTASRPAPPLALWLMTMALVTGFAIIWTLSDLVVLGTLLFWGSLTLFLYISVGYPVLLMVLRRFVARPVTRQPIEPSVCLLITANDEASVMTAKLNNSLAVDYPTERYQIVVASDGSVDATNDIVRSFADRGVGLAAYSTRRGKVATINATLPTLREEIVVFSDANAFLEPAALRHLVRSFADRRVGAVSADVVLEGDRDSLGTPEDLYYRYERWLQHAESQTGSMIAVDGALFAVRRRLFVPPLDDTILDDVAIPMAIVRQGYRVVMEPDAIAREQGSLSAKDEFRRRVRIFAGAVQFLGRRESHAAIRNWQAFTALLSHKILRWLLPIVLTTVLVTSTSLAAISTVYFAAAVLFWTGIALGLLGIFKRCRRWSIVALPYYICLVQAAAVVGMWRGLLGRQSSTWRRVSRHPVELT